MNAVQLINDFAQYIIANYEIIEKWCEEGTYEGYTSINGDRFKISKNEKCSANIKFIWAKIISQYIIDEKLQATNGMLKQSIKYHCEQQALKEERLQNASS
jgi:hypothetical protein